MIYSSTKDRSRPSVSSVASLSAGTRATRQAITKQLRALEGAGLVRSMRSGAVEAEGTNTVQASVASLNFIGSLSREGTKSKTDMCEVAVRRQNISDPQLHHDGHGRKIGKRYSRLVRELFPQFDSSKESRLSDF
jgi:hypothetical protein